MANRILSGSCLDYLIHLRLMSSNVHEIPSFRTLSGSSPIRYSNRPPKTAYRVLGRNRRIRPCGFLERFQTRRLLVLHESEWSRCKTAVIAAKAAVLTERTRTHERLSC